ncbi:hypothetical protein MGLY_03190 [Neomoorella glycerini]|uniref:DUF3870 domain-containing protein n=1 Tax=Neomoorella glycerini TaxID=55779 RepID=A0A6I5ZME3_9FIRM|nr:hypothetical protein MGLY_03190 [Moorella glycerini]
MRRRWVLTSLKGKSVLFSGKAQVPKLTTAYETVKVVTVVLEIDWDSEQIINADFSLYSSVSVEFLRNIVKGYNLKGGLDSLLAEVKSRFHAFSQGAVIQALQIAYERYRDFRTGQLLKSGRES